MEKKRWNKRNSGFSVVEMLAAVAILVILLGIGMVGVHRYQDMLKLTELDNGAREIFLAAENRAVLLSGARRLDGAVIGSGQPSGLSAGVGGGGGTSELYYVTKSIVLNGIESNETDPDKKIPMLLTAGSVDPTLLDGSSQGDFYIVYDLNSGSVTDVFYAEKSLTHLVNDSGFASFYSRWKQSASERLKLKKEAGFLVGHYDGLAAEGTDREQSDLPDPELEVRIENGEELKVTVRYKLPEGASGEQLDVKLQLGNKTVDLMDITSSERRTGPDHSGGWTASYTWTLDSLQSDGLRFKNLPGVDTAALGSSFTVRGILRPRAGVEATFQTATESRTSNSLFQYQGGGSAGTAYIACLRHLQNLDEGSGVNGGIHRAIQTDDIRCRNNDTYPEYNFTPITNKNIQQYSGLHQGKDHAIRNLYIEGAGKHSGLFSRTEGKMAFHNLYLVNACVKAGGQDAGALVGRAEADLTIDKCRVYWETDELVTSLQDTLGMDENDEDHYNYQISGANAGGLVGYAQAGCDITSSLAATLVEGTEAAGGLIGGAGGTVKALISYADCYLRGNGGSAAGLVGKLTGSATLTDCYAAGFITGGKTMAGLCCGTGSTSAQSVYSVMRYPQDAVSTAIFNLTENTGDSFNNTHYLGGESYETMVSDKFVTDMGPAFARKTGAESHPYNLRENLRLSIYSYPGLQALPHYGDWGAQFKEPSLVYYEKYSETSYGVSGGNARTLVRRLENTGSILTDGYAVAFLKTDYKGGDVKLKYSYYIEKTNELNEKTNELVETDEFTYSESDLIETWWPDESGTSEIHCYIIPLREELKLVDSNYAQDCFYRYLRFELNLDGGSTSSDYLFNPHFAETVEPLEAKENHAVWQPAEITAAIGERVSGASMEVLVRTPRHLYDLSQFEEYYWHSGSGRYTFRQVLDLDYGKYTGYEGNFHGTPYRQIPIGSVSRPFTGTYDGGCNEIQNVAPVLREDSDRRYAGLFGYSSGRLEDVVYAMNPDFEVLVSRERISGSLYVGSLAGGNRGSITNCAVYGANISASISGATLYIGGLVGENDGTVRSCAAEFASLSAAPFNFSTVYIGGLVGENRTDRQISSSYAMGRIATNVDPDTTRAARICGFVGYNSGRISGSYAAVDLQPGSDKVEVYGFCGTKAGSQSNTGYLDQGNFTYRNVSYAAKYQQDGDKATSYTYTGLTAPAAAAAFGMQNLTPADPANPDPETDFPYPAVIQDKNGGYVHYGKWPVPMALGEMGVFYWEKLMDSSGDATYHISALAVDPAGGENGQVKVSKQTTLVTDHDDGRYVTNYGYGYYNKGDDKQVEGQQVTVKSRHIGYTSFPYWNERKDGLLLPKDQDEWVKNRDTIRDLHNNRSDQWEAAAEDALEAANGGYTFHCWNTYREAPRATKNGDETYRDHRAAAGICLFRYNKQETLEANSGTLTLTQTGGTKKVEVEFCVNPQFADAMSVNTVSVNDTKTWWTKENGASAVKPGTTEDNPYQIRSGLQLQDINSFDTAYTDVPVGYEAGQWNYSVDHFPYLSGFTKAKDGKETNYIRDYYWAQTHDIDWVKERTSYDVTDWFPNDKGVFFPIAQSFVDKDRTELFMGWFGGTYDGGNYTLKNLAIAINTGAYQTNCMGLFGVTKGATLKNIVMFSESSDEVVEVKGRSDRSDHGNNDGKLEGRERNAWYAGGALVGLAMKGTDKDGNPRGEITNCAVAGYTIVDAAYRTRDQIAKGENINLDGFESEYVDMGGAIGGLVGMTDLDLDGCTASVTIRLAAEYSKTHGDKRYVPLRVGGLVGSTMGNVSNCYTGGTIDATKAKNEVYVGMITGGVGMVTKDYYERNTEKTPLKLENCYSYMTLDTTGSSADFFLYARMNGSYGGYTERDHNYYLGDAWRSGVTGEQSVTYQQLEGTRSITVDEDIYDLLGERFSKVSSTVGGIAAGGKFSFVPSGRKDLQGLDYPFPTVLTMAGYHVHYGAWNISGIQRSKGGVQLGGAPVTLDLFAGDTSQETLTLVSGGKAKKWEAVSGDESIVRAVITGTGDAVTLTYTAQEASATPVTVTITCTTNNGAEYTLPVTVYVTDELELRPGTAQMFPGEELTLVMTAWGKDGKELTGGTLTVTEVTAETDAVDWVPPETEADRSSSVTLRRSADDDSTGSTRLTVTYTYSKDGKTKTDTHSLLVALPALPEAAWNEDGTRWTMTFGTGYTVDTAAWEGIPNGFTLSYSKNAVTLQRADAATPVPADAELTVTFTVDGTQHTVKVPVTEKEAAPGG